MKSSADFYRERLYPLQDGVLKIVIDLQLPFYLTGGTALSRHHLNHRFSDGLDLFVNSDDSFQAHIERFIAHISDRKGHMKLESFTEVSLPCPRMPGSLLPDMGLS